MIGRLRWVESRLDRLAGLAAVIGDGSWFRHSELLVQAIGVDGAVDRSCDPNLCLAAFRDGYIELSLR